MIILLAVSPRLVTEALVCVCVCVCVCVSVSVCARARVEMGYFLTPVRIICSNEVR